MAQEPQKTHDRKNAIILVCNRAYHDYARFVAWQIRQNSANAALQADIVICSDEDLEPDLEGVGAERIDVGVFEDALPVTARLGIQAYWNIPAIEAMTQTYDRVLFLDADLIVRGDVTLLFDLPMKDHAIAAVRDVHQRRDLNREKSDFQLSGLESAPYFNSGVILVDSARWQEEDAFARMLDHARSKPDTIPLHDQTLLNIAFYRNWLEIHPRWNWVYGPQVDWLTRWIAPHVIHCSGTHKPWSRSEGLLPADFHEAYAAFATSVGLEVPSDPALPLNLDAGEKIKNLWYLYYLRPYHDRFASDLDCIDHRDAEADRTARRAAFRRG